MFLHGLAEHVRRYAPFSGALKAAGFSVYAQDYRGHGETAGSIEALGKVSEDAWNGTARDTMHLLDFVLQEQSRLPVFLIGYSIGVALALRIAQERGSDFTGLVLTGGGGGSPEPDCSLLILLTQEEHAVGRQGRSLNQKAIFESFNRPFETAITPFDWLSRDTGAVMDYIHDSLCGIPISTGFMSDFVAATRDLFTYRFMEQIPIPLPVLIMNGTRDESALPEQASALIHQLAALGMENVGWRFYAGARHDLLHEINANAITRHIISWMDQCR